MSVKNSVLRFFTPIMAGAFLLVASCESTTNNTTVDAADMPTDDVVAATLAVAPPIPGIDVPFTTYKVPVSKGMTIETPTGTTIEVPANAFVDKDGNPIEGEVEIDFREFHDATDIVASGIPMHNPETGEYMETAGMFEIKGQQNGQEVFVKGDKNIAVNLASFNEGDDFNFYRLGPKDCRWEDKGTAKPQPNTKKETRLAELDRALPAKPIGPRKQEDAENFIFDLDVNYAMYPELRPFKNVVWEYAGEGKDPEKNDWIFTSNWDDIKLEKSSTGYYELVLASTEKNFKTLVRPVLSGKNYEEALALFNDTKMKEYNDIKEAQQAERARLAAQGNLTRSFNIGGFGIYNWDVWKAPGRVKCPVKPQFDQLAGMDQEINRSVQYFLVQGKRSVVRYNGKNDLRRFSFDPRNNNAMIAVLPEGKVAVFSAADFKKLDVARLTSSTVLLLEMATSVHDVTDMDQLDKVIEEALA